MPLTVLDERIYGVANVLKLDETNELDKMELVELVKSLELLGSTEVV